MPTVCAGPKRWEQNPFNGCNVHVHDGHVGYWGQVADGMSDDEAVSHFMRTANYPGPVQLAVSREW
jgi:hypothetical protein